LVSFENRKPLSSAFRDLGVCSGDIVLVHADLTALRLTLDASWIDAAEYVKNALIDVLGEEGTLVIPTFSWDYCSRGTYIHEKTKSSLGILANSVLFDGRAERSFHPIFSFAGIGPHTRQLFLGVGSSGFGRDSVFHRLLLFNAKIVLLNSRSDIAFVHYVEEKMQVPYRSMKIFSGVCQKGGDRFSLKTEFFARADNDVTDFNGEGLYELLASEGGLKTTQFQETIFLRQIDTRTIDYVLSKRLAENPAFLRVKSRL
jgi:aminoglycoside 3-N-acetyltransferase